MGVSKWRTVTQTLFFPLIISSIEFSKTNLFLWSATLNPLRSSGLLLNISFYFHVLSLSLVYDTLIQQKKIEAFKRYMSMALPGNGADFPLYQYKYSAIDSHGKCPSNKRSPFASDIWKSPFWKIVSVNVHRMCCVKAI